MAKFGLNQCHPYNFCLTALASNFHTLDKNRVTGMSSYALIRTVHFDKDLSGVTPSDCFKQGCPVWTQLAVHVANSLRGWFTQNYNFTHILLSMMSRWRLWRWFLIHMIALESHRGREFHPSPCVLKRKKMTEINITRLHTACVVSSNRVRNTRQEDIRCICHQNLPCSRELMNAAPG